MAVDGALERYETFETVTLGFVMDSLEHSGAGLAAIEEMIAWATARARELGAGADEGWQGEIAALAKKLVPTKGEADTRQGEIVRCLGNVADEAMRNGNVNFGDDDREMIAYLRMHLAGDPMWSELDRTTIARSLTNVARGSTDGGVDRASHRILARFGVRWCRAHPELLPR